MCDGSYKLHHGTAAFALQTGSARAGRILGSNQTPGAEEEQNSFRSELGGIYGIVIVLKQLCQTHHIIAGGIEIACDCLGALQAVFTHEWDDPSQSSFDLIHQIRREIQASPLTWTWRHVKGHQDQHTRFDALDWRSQLNVEMDSLAKAYWNATFTDRTTFYDADPTMWRLSHSGRQFSSLDRKLLYELCHGPPLRAYWRKKYNLLEVAINTIDWKVCDDGIRRLDIFQRIWLAKMTTNTAPTGQILHRRGHQSQPICPRCGQYEDISHVIRCNHPAAIAKWHSGVLSLRAWLERQATSPPLTHLLCQSLLTWHDNLDGHAVPIPAVPEPLLTCFTSQNEIGWHTFLLGFISTHWISVQQAYYTQTESRRTGFRWGCGLFSELIQIPWILWRHRCKIQQEPQSLSTQDEHRRLDALIQEAYDRGTLGWRHRDRRWFRHPVHNLFAEPLSFKTAWLHSVSVTQERHLRRLLNPHAHEQQVMHQFLHPPLPP